MIYLKLKESEKITISRAQFCRYLSGNTGNKKRKRPSAALPANSPGTAALPASPRSFPPTLPAISSPDNLGHDNSPSAAEIVYGENQKPEPEGAE
jgi:hypothetical protein